MKKLRMLTIRVIREAVEDYYRELRDVNTRNWAELDPEVRNNCPECLRTLLNEIDDLQKKLDCC